MPGAGCICENCPLKFNRAAHVALDHTQAPGLPSREQASPGQPPHCRNHRRCDTGLAQSFSRKTEFSVRNNATEELSVSAHGEAPVCHEHPHGLVLPSVRFLRSRTHTSLVTALPCPFYKRDVEQGLARCEQAAAGWPAPKAIQNGNEPRTALPTASTPLSPSPN